jgi:T4-like virus tail tube protein gp19
VGENTFNRSTARTCTSLLACALAFRAAYPADTVVDPARVDPARPPILATPQSAIQGVQPAGTEVVVGGQDMGHFRVLSRPVVQTVTTAQPTNPLGAQPAPRDVTLDGTPNAAQLKYWVDWHEQVVRGNFIRQDVIIIDYDASGREIHRWTLGKAFPTKLTYGPVAAQSNALAISLTLAYETIVTSL